MIATLAVTLSIGYGIAAQTYTHSVPNPDNGPELRALFGQDGDRWSAWFGKQPMRASQDGVVQGALVDILPGYKYGAVLRRFNMRAGIERNTTFFAGTGFGYRDLTTCENGRWAGSGPHACAAGDPYVSSRLAFTQELGVRWKVVEFSVGHFSTGGISYFNKGVSMFRFTLFGRVGRKEK